MHTVWLGHGWEARWSYRKFARRVYVGPAFLANQLATSSQQWPNTILFVGIACFNAVGPILIIDRGPTLRVEIGPTRSLLVGFTLAHAPFANKTSELNIVKPTAALR